MYTNDDASDLCLDAHGMRQESTWIAIVERYRRLLITWAIRCPATAESGESPETIADQALTRAWLALSSKDSGSFPTLAAFLAYLRMCVTHTAIDAVRAQVTQTQVAQSLAVGEVTSPEQCIIEQLERTELWRLIDGLIVTEHERVVLVERFVLGSSAADYPDPAPCAVRR